VIGIKKIATSVHQILFSCLECGAEISEENGKVCFAHMSKMLNMQTGETKNSAKIEFKDLGSYIAVEEPWKKEVGRAMRVLTAWNIPLFSLPPSRGNE